MPAITVDLFGRLLAALDKGQSQDALRPHLYAALLSFLQYSQGRRPAMASPTILTALLKAGVLLSPLSTSCSLSSVKGAANMVSGPWTGNAAKLGAVQPISMPCCGLNQWPDC